MGVLGDALREANGGAPKRPRILHEGEFLTDEEIEALPKERQERAILTREVKSLEYVMKQEQANAKMQRDNDRRLGIHQPDDFYF